MINQGNRTNIEGFISLGKQFCQYATFLKARLSFNKDFSYIADVFFLEQQKSYLRSIFIEQKTNDGVKNKCFLASSKILD